MCATPGVCLADLPKRPNRTGLHFSKRIRLATPTTERLDGPNRLEKNQSGPIEGSPWAEPDKIGSSGDIARPHTGITLKPAPGDLLREELSTAFPTHPALVAQWIEHGFPKPGVASSILAEGASRGTEPIRPPSIRLIFRLPCFSSSDSR
jgi:hypothetical protein